MPSSGSWLLSPSHCGRGQKIKTHYVQNAILTNVQGVCAVARAVPPPRLVAPVVGRGRLGRPGPGVATQRRLVARGLLLSRVLRIERPHDCVRDHPRHQYVDGVVAARRDNHEAGREAIGEERPSPPGNTPVHKVGEQERRGRVAAEDAIVAPSRRTRLSKARRANRRRQYGDPRRHDAYEVRDAECVEEHWDAGSGFIVGPHQRQDDASN